MNRIAAVILTLFLTVRASQGDLVENYYPSGPVVTIDPNLAFIDTVDKYIKSNRDAILSKWYPNVMAHLDSLALGKVQINFAVHPDGTISDMMVIYGDNLIPLKTVCQQAISDSLPFKPYDPAMLPAATNGSLIEALTFTAEPDAAHRQKLILRLKSDIPMLTNQVDTLREKYIAMGEKAKHDVAALHAYAEYAHTKEFRSYLHLRKQLDSDKAELQCLESKNTDSGGG